MESRFCCSVDLNSTEWSALLPENLSPFKVSELRRPCSAYINGLFPGAEVHGEKEQITRIKKFPNYIEYSKIVSDELIPISGQLFLTTKFYDRRKTGWSSETFLQKDGPIMGYCLNGDVYGVSDQENVYNYFYNVVYKDLVSNKPEFIRLSSMITDGICVEFSGGCPEFRKYLKEILGTQK